VGTSAPDWLASALAFKPALIATDADPPGDDAAVRLTKSLKPRGTRMLRLRPRVGKDWNEALTTRGANFLRERLSIFSEAADDETRVNGACDLVESGRKEAANFAAALVSDPLTRELVRERLRRSEQGTKAERVA
jgi:DNA primase